MVLLRKAGIKGIKRYSFTESGDAPAIYRAEVRYDAESSALVFTASTPASLRFAEQFSEADAPLK